ncbi:MAG TPA: GFA family protein [Woeseiaceae bacterium]|nr:GFA family protein [Woeseiaceae bacterium]
MNSGSCLCGDIAWTIDGEFTMLVNCHCSICRKVHGSAYGAFVASSGDGFRWVAGEDKVQVYRSSENGLRPFCPRCGSSVAAVTEKLAYMPAGNMEGDIERSLDSHIFVAHKACWFDITDDAPRFDEFPPNYPGVPVDSELHSPATEGAIGGGCSCGEVRYEFDGPAAAMVHCHCEPCRKSRSAPFSTQAFVPRDRFRWLGGEDHVVHFRDTTSGHMPVSFCRVCSSPLPARLEESDNMMIPAGTIDQDPGIRPRAHCHVVSKAPWVDINDDLPQFDGDLEVKRFQ